MVATVCLFVMFANYAAAQSQCAIDKAELQKLEKRNRYEIKTVIDFKTPDVTPSGAITLLGAVHDRKAGLPIAALINIVGQKLSATANEKGEFSIQIPREKFQVEVIYLGYNKYVSKLLEPEGNSPS